MPAFVLLGLQPISGQPKPCTEINLFDSQENLAKGVFRNDLTWKKNTITVVFLGGSPYLRQKVKYYATQWSKYANVTFSFIESGNADIRVGFYYGKGSWSLIGTDALRYSVDPQRGTSSPGTSGISLNFGWFDAQTSEAEFKRTILHEFGHVLGLAHEHQNPVGGINWNKEAVYAHYRNTQGWTRAHVDRDIFQKYNNYQSNGVYDPLSIMHYPIPAEFTLDNRAVGINSDLSTGDQKLVAKLYPRTEPVIGLAISYRVSDIAYGNGLWALTMSQHPEDGSEFWDKRKVFPAQTIKEHWDKGFKIAHLSFAEDNWVLVMKKSGRATGRQLYLKNAVFPEKEINAYYKKGYQLTNVAYGQKSWVVVLSKSRNNTSQQGVWFWSTGTPERTIEYWWGKNYRLRSLDYYEGRWIWGMEKTQGSEGQTWVRRAEFPAEDIQKGWGKGYHILRLAYGQGGWMLIMSDSTGFRYQSWRTRLVFPAEEIRDLWEK